MTSVMYFQRLMGSDIFVTPNWQREVIGFYKWLLPGVWDAIEKVFIALMQN